MQLCLYLDLICVPPGTWDWTGATPLEYGPIESPVSHPCRIQTNQWLPCHNPISYRLAASTYFSSNTLEKIWKSGDMCVGDMPLVGHVGGLSC